ncbi:MAG: HD-GYP domain-containing protein [Piscinibacter sp.]|uniref:HD-GYP domain-containing protein n=1 Tax=Piscinibacter sp. TaxID=1903157 RepID=UPI003D144FD7
MSTATVQETIDVASLRVGMFVHLDLGWLSHPFPLSSFRISSEEQIATIRALGLRRVRWSSAHSDLTEVAGTAAPARRHEDTALQAPQESPEQRARREHREKLAAQRAGLLQCERQFAEATREIKRAMEMAGAKPEEAGTHATALARGLADKMLGAGDLCIRLLTEAAGDKASAHALNVTLISMLMGRTFGLAEPDMIDLGTGALMHDVGKLELPDRVRYREDHFSAAEQRLYEEHVAFGIAAARRMGLSPGASLVVAQHHEHADGSGFPLKLNTDRMSPLARIVALVNRYDRLCNPHIVGKALTPHEALSMLFAQSKTKFDTAILGAFIKMMGVYPPGSAVQLTDDRYALVVSVNSSRPLKPRVLVHESGVPRDEALIVDLEKAEGLGIRRSLRPQQLPPTTLAYLAPRPRVAYFFEPAGDAAS